MFTPSKVVIPNAITGMSIFAGYLAIALSLDGRFLTAAWLILLAGILDSFDGRVARAIGATSEFGIQFDSLADAVNYGVAPSLLFFSLYFNDWGMIGMMLGFLPVLCAMVRLAGFNTQATEENKGYFHGLPTTAAALFLVSYVIFAQSNPIFNQSVVAAVLVMLAAVLMVSPVRYEKNNLMSPHRMFKDRRSTASVVVLVTIIVLPSIALFAWCTLYICFGLARGLVMIIKDSDV